MEPCREGNAAMQLAIDMAAALSEGGLALFRRKRLSVDKIPACIKCYKSCSYPSVSSLSRAQGNRRKPGRTIVFSSVAVPNSCKVWSNGMSISKLLIGVHLHTNAGIHTR